MSYHRDEVFVAGGQPSVTYVEREQLHIERNLARAIATSNQIVSLAGPTKTGKTVLCRKVLGERDYIWTDGGQVGTADELWRSIFSELKIPNETSTSAGTDTSVSLGLNKIVTAAGSRLRKTTTTEVRRAESMADAIKYLLEDRIVLVIDDFHYMPPSARTAAMRNIKGAVYNGLKVILLSATHRAFDAITAEPELTGRFNAITMPNWSRDDLLKIAELGFSALRVDCDQAIVGSLATEAQESPFLMQQFCWEMCYDCNIERAGFLRQRISADYDPEAMFVRLAENAGLPVYQSGPQSRRARVKRPLSDGKEADIYEATLLALSETGPKSSVSYEELRSSLTKLLTDMVPQKHEITSALKHLASISVKSGSEGAIDWDEDKREINLSDPYLRFYLRWQVRSRRQRELGQTPA